MRPAGGAQAEAAAGHFLEARGQVKLGLAVDLVREVVRAVALGGGLGGESFDLGDERGRGGRGLARRGLGPALSSGARMATITAGLKRDCWMSSPTAIKPSAARMP